MKHIFFIIILVYYISHTNTHRPNIVFVILSQSNEYHTKLASEVKRDILNQSTREEQFIIHISHEDFPHVGGWTIIPLIPHLTDLYGMNTSFLVFLQDHTRVNLQNLVDCLQKYEDEIAFLGFGLYDNEPSIIHHFAFYDNPHSFKYPNLASGFVITTNLLKRLNVRIRTSANFETDFSIDSAHELAVYIWNNNKGYNLIHNPEFCITDGPTCATYQKVSEPCKKIVSKESIYFAVKTCAKFHQVRVPIVKKTWGKRAITIKYFSDVEDHSIPTINLGVQNTEHGHCEKTFAIIRYVTKEIKTLLHIRWLIIADDDTILSVSGLQDLLSCYNSSKAVAVGERYGYRVNDPQNGYNYITGGGGMAFSIPAVMQLADPNNCICPSVSTPDDMYLGFCMKKIGITITHSPLFHQARPADYADGYLNTYNAVSFHKHWMVDPVKVYNTWFSDSDDKSSIVHTEL